MDSIVYCCIFLIIGTVIFMSGYHAVDTAWNMKAAGSNLDVNFFGTAVDADALYGRALYTMLVGFCMTAISAVCIGIRGRKYDN